MAAIFPSPASCFKTQALFKNIKANPINAMITGTQIIIVFINSFLVKVNNQQYTDEFKQKKQYSYRILLFLHFYKLELFDTK